MTLEREEHWIPVDGGESLHAWVLRRTDLTQPAPAVTVAHGFGGLAEGGLLRYAESFAEAGFVAVLHDHRSFGLSTGWPRQDIDPWQQIHDWRLVITYLQDLPGVDPDRIGLFGSSYAGGHALVLAGSDPRIKAVVAQIPTISGYEQSKRRLPTPEARKAFQERFVADERARLHGADAHRLLLVSDDPDVPSVFKDPRGIGLEDRFPVEGEMLHFDHKVTLRSSLKAQMYDPGVWIDRISPTPLLMIVGLQDVVTPTDTQLAAFEQAGEPKKLITYDGDHFSAYDDHFKETGGGARDWFVQHLAPTATH
ncbi:alpha/beta hydrolase [Streptomyces sp. NPDC090493]|uniref:alpha/beta hydrolase n=1 Tax=Streptomyces sp. NPDC090493 TaxID=3365964 RepID=UPI003800E1FB